MPANREAELMVIGQKLRRIRGDRDRVPNVSIIIPVNAQADLNTVLQPLRDIAGYGGASSIEVVLVINNYEPDQVLVEIEEFRRSAITVVATPSARRSGEVVIISARALGVRAAESELTIHLDADCRIPHIDAFVDWYVGVLGSGTDLAYSHVAYYELHNRISIWAKIAVHHSARWIKRRVLGIPTTRGSNYGITRSLFLAIYDAGKMSVDLQVGPAARLQGAQIVYSGRREVTVLTSGRRFRGGWIRLLRYFAMRLKYNRMAIPTRRREVTRTSWDGFDRESDNRRMMDVAAAKDRSQRPFQNVE